MVNRGVSRRHLIAAIGGTAVAVPLSGLRAQGMAAPLLASRGDLARQAGVPGALFRIDEAAGGGWWRWEASDRSAAVCADPLQGLTIAHAAIPPSRGAWVREWDGIVGRAEWFGARADTREVDCQPAIQAAVELCPTVQLGPGSYHVARRIQILRNGTRLIGAWITQTDQGPNVKATRIVGTSATETILQVGPDSATQPGRLTETVQLADFTVVRATAPYMPTSGFGSAIGIAMKWCVNCHVERVFSIDSGRGWFFSGTIENYIKTCAALRRRPGTDPANDHFIGFHLDYNAPLAANGGNASLYIDHCRAFGGFDRGVPPFVYSAGLRTDGGWVDLFINALETGTLRVGIDGHGDAVGAAGFRTENLSITNCVLDPGYDACIRLTTGNRASAVQISGNYCGVSPQGASIVLADLAGSVSLTANQCIVGEVGGVGLAATNVNNLRSANNIFTKHRRPIRLERCTNFHVADSVKGIDAPNGEAAVALVGCARGTVACTVSGAAGVYGTGVELVGRGNSAVEVNGTGLAGVARKLVSDGRAVTVAGPFGNGCLASGVMG